MDGMTEGDLKAILVAGDVDACLAYFEHATEEERKAVASQALDWYAKQNANSMIAASATSWRANPLLGAAAAAVLASSSLAQIKKRGLNLRDNEVDLRVFEARKPDWLTEFAAWSLEKSPMIWPTVRRLERAGLCRRPSTDHYVLGMITGGPSRFGPPVREALLDDPELLQCEVWRLFEVEESGEFSLAARDKYCRVEMTWEAGLLALAAEGVLPRGRLLDASLDALERDFAQFRAGWFSRFHEALQPTLDERAERVERYLHLIASRIPPTVSFALSALSKLDRAGRLPALALVERINPALVARSKGAVTSALKLLENASRREPSLKPCISKTAAHALAHESPEVQSLAFDLIAGCGDSSDAALVGMVRDQLDQLAASIQPRVREWLGRSKSVGKPAPAPAATTEGEFETLLARTLTIAPEFRELAGIDAAVEAIRAGRFDVTALAIDGTEFPRLDPDSKIAPIVDLDELIDIFSKVLENPDASEDVERVLDGVSRLCDRRPAGFDTLTKPLRKRALALLERHCGIDSLGPFCGWEPLLDLCGLILSWIDRQVLDPDAKPRIEKEVHDRKFAFYDFGRTVGKWGAKSRVPARRNEMHFLSRRALAVARWVARGEVEGLLSAPTHRGGWIDPLVVVDRIGVRTWQADLLDQVQAILRLAPDHREEARRKMTWIEGQFAQVIQYTFGGEIDAVGPTAALWVAAARARATFCDDHRRLERHADLGPDAGEAARYEYRVKIKRAGEGKTWAEFHLYHQPNVPADVPAEFPTVLLHSHPGEVRAAVQRWGAMIWPIAGESWLARGVENIGINLDWWEAQWNNRTYLERLNDPDVPLKPMALLLLTLGLAAKQADEHGLATDALIAAVDDGRIDGLLLGRSLRALLASGLVKTARWAKTMRDAARVSPLHARIIAHAIQIALEEGLAEPPRDLLVLLELLKELLAEIGEPVSQEPLRTWLAGWKTSGKTGKVVNDLLALCEKKDGTQRRAAAIRALAQRIERAERWSRNAC
jgi:hypothetical protein